MSKSGSGSTMYADYLKLDVLLGAQQQLSAHPDEMHFIIVHQIHELWFKLILHQLARARAALQADQPVEATRLLNQAVDSFRNLRVTTEHLQSLPASAFLSFRKFLAPGSGMQSFQFRKIEFLLGHRDAKYVEWVKSTLGNDQHLAEIEARLAEPSLAQAFEEMLASHNLTDLAAIYRHPERCPEFYALAETLCVLEHQIILWRYAHIQLVERTLGAAAIGTGGTTHDYLQNAARTRFFPALWEARNELVRRMDAEG